MSRIIILGDAGHAMGVNDCLGGECVLFGRDGGAVYDSDRFVFGFVDDSAERRQLVERFGVERFISAVHRTAIIHQSVKLGISATIMAGAILQAQVRLGSFVVVNTGAQLDHHTQVGDFAYIGPGAVLCGGITVEPDVYIGAGAVVLPGLSIGAGAMVGAGAIVTRNVPSRAVLRSEPSRVTRMKRDDEP